MGALCKIWGCKDSVIKIYSNNVNYALMKCSRCDREIISCVYEGQNLTNDLVGLKILNKMMTDKEFSKACHIHSLFVKVEGEFPFMFRKQEQEFEKIQKQFNLDNAKRPASPIELFKAGLWIDKPLKKEHKDKKEGESDKFKYMPFPMQEVQPIKYKFEEGELKKTKNKTVNENTPLWNLEDLLKKYLDEEDYLNAAIIRDLINKKKK